MSSTREKDRLVEVVPWLLCDKYFTLDEEKTLDPRKTIYVSNLPIAIKAGKVYFDHIIYFCYFLPKF